MPFNQVSIIAVWFFVLQNTHGHNTPYRCATMTLPRRGGRYLTTLRRPDAAAVNARDLALVFMKMQSIALEQQARIDGEALRAARQIRAASLGRTGYARSLISTTQVLRRERATSLRGATSPAAAAAAAAEMAKARSSGKASSKQRKSSKRKLSSSDGGASDDRLTSDLKRRPTGRLPKTVTGWCRWQMDLLQRAQGVVVAPRSGLVD